VSAEQIRIEKHGLQKEGSLVIPNGITKIEFSPNNMYRRDALVYVGAITKQHGIVDVVENNYAKSGCQTPLYIFGGGTYAQKLTSVIAENSLGDIVKYFGFQKKEDIESQLAVSPLGFIGFAPYLVSESGSHTAFGDSLKIKEYIAIGIPFLTSEAVSLPEDIKQFGVVYKSEEEMSGYLANPAEVPILSFEKVAEVLVGYTWDSLLKKIPLD
jgi:glycosyltransferase involved in cell wall biosynthesis